MGSALKEPDRREWIGENPKRRPAIPEVEAPRGPLRDLTYPTAFGTEDREFLTFGKEQVAT